MVTYTLRCISILVLLCLMVSIFPSVEAHTIKKDGNIGVLLHIDPDDAPIAKKPVIFILEIEDSTNIFPAKTPSQCNCTLTIKKQGNTIWTTEIASGDVYKTLSYTFAESGTYEIIVSGSPKDPAKFTPFLTQFEYFVASNGDSIGKTDSVNPLLQFIPMITAFVGSAIILLFVL